MTANPSTCGGEHHKGPHKILTKSLDQSHDRRPQVRSLKRSPPHVHDAAELLVHHVDESPEVAILGNQDALLVSCDASDPVIRGAGRDLRDGCDVVTGGAKSADDALVCTLVGQKAQGQSPSAGATVSSTATVSAA